MTGYQLRSRFHEHFKMIIWWYKVLGLWPNKKFFAVNLYLVVTFIGLTIIIWLSAVHLTKLIILSKISLMTAIESCYLACMLLISVPTKTYYHIKHFSETKALLKMIDKNYFEPKSQLEVDIINIPIDVWGHLAKFYATLCILANVLAWVCGILQTQHEFLINIWVPCDKEGNLCFGVWLPLQFLGAIVETIVLFGICLMIAGFAVYVGGQLDLLDFKIRNMYEFSRLQVRASESQGLDEYNSLLQEQLSKNFRDILEHHRAVIEFVEKVNVIAGEPLFFIYISTIGCLVVCLLLCLISEDSVHSIFYLSCGACFSGELMLLSWFGNEVIHKSMQLANAAYESYWEECSIQHKKRLLFFIRRAQRPIKFLAIDIIPLTLAIGTTILRTSWSYFLVLQHVYGDK